MTTAELIEALKTMPQDAKVYHLWDGEPRTEINVVYRAKNGSVITADYDEPCYNVENSPEGVENRDWKTGPNPKD